MKRQLIVQQVLVTALMLLFCSSVLATTITVANNAAAIDGDGKCSLQEAVQAANTNLAVDTCPAGQSSAVDVININYFGTITLGSTLIITEAVHIQGLGRAVTRLNGNNQRQIMRVIMDDMTDDFSVEKLRFEQARSTNTLGRTNGAVQLEQGNKFTFTSVSFADNHTYQQQGTAIFTGPLTGNTTAKLYISACSFSDNTSVGYGSAIHSSYNSDIGNPQNNKNPLDTISIEDCEFKNNSSDDGSSAIYAYGVKNVFVKASIFKDNDTDGGSTVGVYGVSGQPRPMAIIENNTFMNNTAAGSSGGVSIYQADALLSQNTFYNNIGEAQFGTGGALSLSGSTYASLFYNTFIENSRGTDYDGNIQVNNGASLDMVGNIIFSTSEDDNDCRVDVQGVYQSLGGNIDGDGTCGGHASDAVTADPKLNPIGTFGGNGNIVLQYTMPPMANSVAIDSGPANNCTGAFGVTLVKDQRGMNKPVDGNDDAIVACDAGATEYQPGVDPELPILTVDVSGSGTINIAELDENCSAVCSYPVEAGAALTLTPVVENGQGFQGFSGVCAGQNPCQLTVQADTTVAATFVSTLRQLTVSVNGSGSVVSTPAGIDCDDSCNAQFELNEVVGLQANAEAGWEFSHWSNSCNGTSPSCDVTITGAKTVVAHFSEIPDMVNLTVSVTGLGSVGIAELSASCSAVCNYEVEKGTVLTLNPTAGTGQDFDDFSGICTGQNPCQITMQADQSVGATFVAQQRQLMATVVGSGTITSSPAGISCSNSCNAMYDYNQVVTLQAQASPGWGFSHWSGVCSGMPTSCDVTMTSNKTATAHFTAIPDMVRLSLDVSGSGTVGIAELSASCSAVCNYDVEEGTVLTLTPNAATGQDFDGFSGVCAGQDPCQITMQANQSVSASFIPQQKQLMITVVGGGSVTGTPGGINCNSSCNATYDYNEVVSLVAQAESGWTFSHWSGVCSGSPESCSVTMSSTKTTTAHFEEVSTEEVIFSASFED